MSRSPCLLDLGRLPARAGQGLPDNTQPAQRTSLRR